MKDGDRLLQILKGVQAMTCLLHNTRPLDGYDYMELVVAVKTNRN